METNSNSRAPRSVRNNNPLNLRRNLIKWQGLASRQEDSEFCQFESPAWGWRAAFIVLTRTYYYKYHLNTLRKIINRWAPPNENNTSAYLNRVCKITHLNADFPLPVVTMNPGMWLSIGYAMAIVEAGREPDVTAMLTGWDWAMTSHRYGTFEDK
jgi:hypothetical protein